jgi:F-type H+-transporting ATPase subunit delta
VTSLTIARKYARALLEIGQQGNTYEELGKELDKMAHLLKENKELKGLLLSPIYPGTIRKKIILEISKMLGLSKPMVDFIFLLIDRKRIDHFFEILKSYEILCDAVAKRLRATVIIASDSSSSIVEAIKNQLESSTGKQVVLTVEKDPSLIGGALTKIGNIVYDGSLKAQLFKVKENLLKE